MKRILCGMGILCSVLSVCSPTLACPFCEGGFPPGVRVQMLQRKLDYDAYTPASPPPSEPAKEEPAKTQTGKQDSRTEKPVNSQRKEESKNKERP